MTLCNYACILTLFPVCICRPPGVEEVKTRSLTLLGKREHVSFFISFINHHFSFSKKSSVKSVESLNVPRYKNVLAALKSQFLWSPFNPITAINANRLFPSSWLPPLQSESKCEVFVIVIGSTLHMNKN